MIEKNKTENKNIEYKNIVVVNTKGGSSKSTVSLQAASTYFLNKNQEANLFEFDDENLDSANFTKTKIKCNQVNIDDGKDLNSTLRELLVKKDMNKILDVGGNKTTTIFIDSLIKSRMYKRVDLFIIPVSSGHQDVENAEKTYNMIKDLDVNIIFALSRSRHNANSKRVKFQYNNFFKKFPEADFFVLKDSDVVDLSRIMQKSCYELAKDDTTKKELNKKLDEAFDTDDEKAITNMSVMLEILDDAEEFYRDNLINAYEVIAKNIHKG